MTEASKKTANMPALSSLVCYLTCRSFRDSQSLAEARGLLGNKVIVNSDSGAEVLPSYPKILVLRLFKRLHHVEHQGKRNMASYTSHEYTDGRSMSDGGSRILAVLYEIIELMPTPGAAP